MELNFKYSEEYISEDLKANYDANAGKVLSKYEAAKSNLMSSILGKKRPDPLRTWAARQNRREEKAAERRAKKQKEADKLRKMKDDAEAAFQTARKSEKTTPYIKGGKDNKNRLINPNTGKGYGGVVRKNVYGKNFPNKNEQAYKKLFPVPPKKYKLKDNPPKTIGKISWDSDKLEAFTKKYQPARKSLSFGGKLKKAFAINKQRPKAKLKVATESYLENLNFKYK